MTKSKTIVLCSSADFYKHVAEVGDELETCGYKAIIPLNARTMRKTGNYKVADYKTWYENPADFVKKRFFIDQHFAEIAKSDAILMVNDSKRGVVGYIGPNGLMEMAVAYYLKKPIFILNDVPSTNPIYEEVMGMNAHILHGDIRKLEIN